MKKIVAITMVKNEMDIIESFVRHTLGFADVIMIADHQSTDRTREILTKLRVEGLPIHMESVTAARHVQAETMTRLLQEAANREKADLILPIDADEFLLPRGDRSVRQALQSLSMDSVRSIHIYPYALQREEGLVPGRFLLDAPLCHAQVPMPTQRIVLDGDFVRREHVVIGEGNHGISLGKGFFTGPFLTDVFYAHFPWRSRLQSMANYVVCWPNIAAKYSMHTLGGGFYRKIFHEMLQGKMPERDISSMVACDLHGRVPMPPLRYSEHTTPDVLRNVMAASEVLAAELAETRAFSEKPVVTTIVCAPRGTHVLQNRTTFTNDPHGCQRRLSLARDHLDGFRG